MTYTWGLIFQLFNDRILGIFEQQLFCTYHVKLYRSLHAIAAAFHFFHSSFSEAAMKDARTDSEGCRSGS